MKLVIHARYACQYSIISRLQVTHFVFLIFDIDVDFELSIKAWGAVSIVNTARS